MKQSVEKLIRWLFNMFVVPLVSACFYVTETSGPHKHRIFYYRKPMWRVLSRLGMQPLLGSLFTPLSNIQVNELNACDKFIGVHAIRMLPSHKKV